MEQNDALSLFRKAGAFLEGHFRLSSGLHSTGYMQSALVLQNPTDAGALGSALADRVKEKGPLDPTDAARLVVTVARAIHAAHELGVHPCIIVGRLQRERVLDWSDYRRSVPKVRPFVEVGSWP